MHTELPSSFSPPRYIIVLGVLIFLAVIIVGLWLLYSRSPDQIQGMADADEINIAAKITGRPDRLLVHEGDSVHPGQLLATISSPEIEAKQQQARAALSGAEAKNQEAINGARVEDIAAALAQWHQAQAVADLTRKTFERTNRLFQEGVISTQRRDEAKAQADSAAQAARAARAVYEKARTGTRSEEKGMAHALVQQARGGLAEVTAFKDETELRAPLDGEIAKRIVNQGEIVPAGYPIFTMINLSNIWVSLNVREDQFHGLKMGQIITGDIPALDRKDVRFKVNFISPEGDFATWRAVRASSGYDIKTFEVRARPVQPIQGLRPGMSILFTWPQ